MFEVVVAFVVFIGVLTLALLFGAGLGYINRREDERDF